MLYTTLNWQRFLAGLDRVSELEDSENDVDLHCAGCRSSF